MELMKLFFVPSNVSDRIKTMPKQMPLQPKQQQQHKHNSISSIPFFEHILITKKHVNTI